MARTQKAIRTFGALTQWAEVFISLAMQNVWGHTAEHTPVSYVHQVCCKWSREFIDPGILKGLSRCTALSQPTLHALHTLKTDWSLGAHPTYPAKLRIGIYQATRHCWVDESNVTIEGWLEAHHNVFSVSYVQAPSVTLGRLSQKSLGIDPLYLQVSFGRG